MHTAPPGSDLEKICVAVARMKPGERLTVDRHILRLIQPLVHNDTIFTPAHRVLENVIGSAHTHSFSSDMETGSVTFHRYENTGERRYSSPDDDVRLKRLEADRKYREQGYGINEPS